jgi:hypothetical protein
MMLSYIKNNQDLNARLGRVAYGNLCSFSYNFEGRRNLHRLRAKAPQAVGQTSVFLKAMSQYGFYQPPTPIKHELMSEVIADYLSALADTNRSKSVMSQKAKEAGLGIYCRAVDETNVSKLGKLLTAENDSLITAYFGGPPEVRIACARRNEHVPPRIAQEFDIYSNSWHCDNEPSDRLKMFVALSDIDADCGPLHLLSRPTTRRMLWRGFKNRDDYGMPIGQIEDPNRLVKFVGSIGSVMFVNVTQCLHRAGVPAPGHHRDIAEFQFRAG